MKGRIRDHFVGAGVMCGLVALAVVGWWGYSGWKTGEIELSTEGAPLVAQVLHERSDRLIGGPVVVADRAVVTLPQGEYRLRVNGKGRVGRTYRFAVNRGERQSHAISLDEGRLLEGEPEPPRPMEKTKRLGPVPFTTVTAALQLESGKVDFIQWSEGSLVRRDGARGNIIWDAFHPATAFDRKHDPAQWFPTKSPNDENSGEVIETAQDLNGDGTNDLVWFFRENATFLALSGKDGSVLWNHVAKLETPGAGGRRVARLNSLNSQSTIAGTPVMADVDHDGTPDIIATALDAESAEEHRKRVAESGSDSGSRTSGEVFFRRVAMAISGRSGNQLWSYPIDREFTSPRDELLQKKPPAAPVKAARTSLIAVVDDDKWFGLDPANGKVRVGPIDLGFSPVRPLAHADLDADGEPEIVALGPGSTGAKSNVVRAFSIKTGRELWGAEIGSAYELGTVEPFEKRFKRRPMFPDCCLIADLDGDGKAEIVVADTAPMPPLSGSRGVRLIDGVTGTTRWRQPMRGENAAEDGMSHIVAAPDLDGDGTSDVITVSRFDGRSPPARLSDEAEEPERVFVDAFSGKDGRPLWWWSVDLPVERFTRIRAPGWWGRGRDGWPLLALPLGGKDPEELPMFNRNDRVAVPVVHLLELSTGREQHTVPGLTSASFTDLDGDGLTDLWGDVDGELRAFRGEAPEAWRALGHFKPAEVIERGVGASGRGMVDFDGDGVADTLASELDAPGNREHRSSGSRAAVARSGRDGHLIWKTLVDPRGSWFNPTGGDRYVLSAFPPPEGDLDGDGIAEVVVRKQAGNHTIISGRETIETMEALSGRTGARLWSATGKSLDVAFGDESDEWLEPRVIEFERHGAPDLIVSRAPAGRAELARVSGRDGRTVWAIPTSDGESSISRGKRLRFYDDLDGDGGLDALLVVPHSGQGGSDQYTMLAISLRDGKRLWSQKVRFQDSFKVVGDLRVGDLDGDKKPEVIALEAFGEDEKNELGVRVFDGADGKLRWAWKSGFVPGGSLGEELLALANLDGKETRQVCVNFPARRLLGFFRRIVVLDGAGKERARRDIGTPVHSGLAAFDCNGDGKDELIVLDGDMTDGRLCALDRELKDVWAWPPRSKMVKPPRFDAEDFRREMQRAMLIDRVVPPIAGVPSEVIVMPPMAIDAVKGRPIWMGQGALVAATTLDPWQASFAPTLLDRGDSTRRPLLIGNGMGATVCREGMASDAEGRIAAAAGRAWMPRAGRSGDPRWTRSLPWRARLKGLFGPRAFLGAGGLALLNVVLPLLILRMIVGRRRVFRMWVLMVMPVAAVVPLMVYTNVVSWLPVGEEKWLETEQKVFLAGTVAGVPIVLGAWWVIAALFRRQWRRMVGMAMLILVATSVVAGGWIWRDRKLMAAIENYGWEGWELVVMVGGFVAAILWGVGMVGLGGYRMVKGWRRVS